MITTERLNEEIQKKCLERKRHKHDESEKKWEEEMTARQIEQRNEGWRQKEKHLFSEMLAVVIFNKEVQVIRFLSLWSHGCHWKHKSQPSQVPLFSPLEIVSSLLTCLSFFNAARCPKCQRGKCRRDHWPKSFFSSTLTSMFLHLLSKSQNTNKWKLLQYNPQGTLHNEN